MNRSDDEYLRSRFDDLSEYDAKEQPEFGTLLHRTGHRRGNVLKHPRWIAWASAAAVIVLVGAIGGVTRLHRDKFPLEANASVTAITNWQSPTAALLKTPTRHLLSPPALLSSVLDTLLPSRLQPKPF